MNLSPTEIMSLAMKIEDLVRRDPNFHWTQIEGEIYQYIKTLSKQAANNQPQTQAPQAQPSPFYTPPVGGSYHISLPPGLTLDVEKLYAKVATATGNPNLKSCTHNWKTYTGLTSTYEYCTKCDKKLGEKGIYE
jgi:hypothetical protein